MFFKNKPAKWIFWPFKKKANPWERYESLWVVLISISLVSSLAYGLKTIIEPPTESEEIYLSPSAFIYKERDFFISQNQTEKKPLSHLELVAYLDALEKLNPFTTLTAQAEVPFEEVAALPEAENTTSTLTLVPEPEIRIGLTYGINPVIISSTHSFTITNFNQEPLLKLNAGDQVTLRYNYDTTYSVITPEHNIISSSYIILKPNDPDGVFEIENYFNPPPWNQSLNDNRFRGALEFAFTPATNRTWLINELKMEDYLKGLGETTSYAPLEYLEVMTIAARSYALWHNLEQHKYQYELYDVQANQNDQVYRGYEAEARHPNLSLATENTRGLVTTYKNNLAIIPYFAGSSGKTYSWEKIWGNKNYPWVESQEVPEEIGYVQLGHGVGLSQRGALIKVKNGATKEEVFADFFPEISLQNIYVP